jgi:hypothetical protein
LSENLATLGEVEVAIEYRNVAGYVLRPCIPQSILFDHQKPAPYPDQHLTLPEHRHVDEDPEEAILPILKSIYGAFGLDARFVPFYDENSGFSIG